MLGEELQLLQILHLQNVPPQVLPGQETPFLGLQQRVAKEMKEAVGQKQSSHNSLIKAKAEGHF